RATFTTPPQTVPGTNTTEPPPPPLRNKGPELGADNLTLEGVATELAPSDFVSQNYETLVALMQEETKKRSSQSLQARLNFGPGDEVSPPRHQKERRGKDNRRPPVFGRIGKKVSGTQTANLQNLDTHENNVTSHNHEASQILNQGPTPFTIAHVYPYGIIELSQTDGPNFKVNGHRLKHYFGGDIPHMVVSDLQTFPKDQ
ncbi:hypothetical protein Tco_1460441, partial [Tanacetum coccineum]